MASRWGDSSSVPDQPPRDTPGAAQEPDEVRLMIRRLKRAAMFRSGIVLIALLSLGYVVPGVPWQAIGGVLIGIGVVAILPTLWSMRGSRLREWGLAPATARDVVSIFSGAALAMLGMALIAMSVIPFPEAEWEASIMAIATLVCVYGAVVFLSVASLARKRLPDA